MQNLQNAQDSSVAKVYRSILASVPFEESEELKGIRVPVLVLANHQDPIHPFELAERLAAAIPGAMLREFPSKHEGAEEHQQGFRENVKNFLRKL